MLFAASQTDFAGAHLRSALFLDRAMRMHVMSKHRLRWDSRFAPPSPVVRPVVTVYVVAAGTMQTGPITTTTPAVWILAETELERPTRTARWFRADGDPSMTIEMRLAASAVRGPIGLAAGPRALAPTTWARR